MAWTQNDIDALKSAMALGIRRVRYTSGEVEYQSVADMKSLLRDMERDVSADGIPRRTVARFVSGY